MFQQPYQGSRNGTGISGGKEMSQLMKYLQETSLLTPYTFWLWQKCWHLDSWQDNMFTAFSCRGVKKISSPAVRRLIPIWYSPFSASIVSVKTAAEQPYKYCWIPTECNLLQFKLVRKKLCIEESILSRSTKFLAVTTKLCVWIHNLGYL